MDFPEHYIPRRELGEGSMGAVWLAYSERAGGHCAVKVLSLRQDRRGSAERSFNREVRAMARLKHPSVIEVHDYGRTPEGSPYLAMEYVPGGSLHGYARAGWTWPRLWTLIDGLLAGLGHAHARELVHRDLKPGNVLVVPEHVGPGTIKLVDFGIALAVPEAGKASRRIEGTPAYIAPEAASGDVRGIGPWTDLYSLGVMLFEILTGDLPFHGRHLLVHHQHSPLPEIRVRDEVEAPAALVPIVERLLEKRTTRRFRSVAELREALRALGPPPPAAAFGPPPTRISWDEDEPEAQDEQLRPLTGPAGPALFHLREPPIAGREAAQLVLKRAAHAALEGAGPRVVLIEGEAGLGKSRLAGWLREWLDETGLMRTLLVRSEPHSETGGGLRQAALRSLGAPNAQPREAAALLAETFADEESRQNARAVLWPEPDEVLTGERPIVRAARLVRDLAGDSPFLLWVDDAQWSPEGRSLQLVHRLAQPDGPRRLLLVATLRPSLRTTVQAARRALLALPNCEYLPLSPLPPLALAPALEALAPLPAGLAEAACVQAAGNPLMALESVRSFLEAEGLASAPADPGAILRQRIELATRGPRGGDLRSALARATLLGRSFTLRPLARLCAVPGDPDAPGLCEAELDALDGLIEQAVSAGLLVEQGPRRWRFSHDLVRAELRTECRKLPNWAELNLAAASLRIARAKNDHTGIELEVVARYHWEGEQPSVALRLGLEGAQRLHGAGLMGHATSFCRRLLEWDDQVHLLSAEERAELHLLGSDAAEHAGQPYEAERHAREAVDIAWRNRLEAVGARAASRLGGLKIKADEMEEAERWLWDALRFARQSGELRARSNAHLILGRFYQHRDQLDLALTAYEASLESARTGELLREELATRSAIAGIDRLEHRLERAVETFDEVAEAASAAGLEVLALEARLQLGLCAWAADDPEAARTAFEEVRRGARGNLFVLEFWASLGEAWAHAAEGRWTDAELVLMQAEDLRYDVRLHDAEAERLRRALRALAIESRRGDIVERVDKLDVMVTRTHSTSHPAPESVAE